MQLNPAEIYKDIWSIRQKSPLVHNITNYVVMNNTANALLALGASPVMAHAEDEVEDMVSIAGALVINIGTLSPEWVRSMVKAAKKAKENATPIVLDPVGVGATPYRTDTARDLVKEAPPEIIRGNGSEIMALSQAGVTTRGVDSTSGADQAIESAKNLNTVFKSVICVTGKTDYILAKDFLATIDNGHEIMPRVTGLGCTATALCGAFAAVNLDYKKAAAHAMAVMGIAGEMAAENAKGPGSFQVAFIDALYQISENDIQTRLRG
ncbi:MAG: hydroxyethylthiazole kinase [Desulfobacter sp.]|nr:hydroxyethylthiazole kinase [Desulfobacter sp.]WDP84011.1 MAG: hydroxyethylthiazole kinase [Desulfobacter sp.]